LTYLSIFFLINFLTPSTVLALPNVKDSHSVIQYLNDTSKKEPRHITEVLKEPVIATAPQSGYPLLDSHALPKSFASCSALSLFGVASVKTSRTISFIADLSSSFLTF
jgi:hypothetical protein